MDSRISLAVSSLILSSPGVEKTSAFPFRTNPALALFGVNVTANPSMETLKVSPGLMESSCRTCFGKTIRPAWSIGANVSFMLLKNTFTI